jgi:hypothetical protein
MNDFHTCRLCGQWQTDRHTGPMYKYSVRHYAHVRCGVVRWGREWLDQQPDWIIRQFPYFLARDLMIEDYLRERLSKARA